MVKYSSDGRNGAMGFNISDVSGNGASEDGLDGWVFTGDLNDGSMKVVTGDFNAVAMDGTDQGEAAGGYTFGALSTTAYGTLSFNTANGEFSFTVNRAAVIASGADQTVSFTVTGRNGSGGSDSDTVTINLLICVARGTLVETARGKVPVERIAVGDAVVTRDAGLQPVRWIGSRRVSAAELAARPELRPVRLMPGALGQGRPARALRVSPQHRVLLTDWRAQVFFGEDEVLVPARALVNGDTIHREGAGEGVEYFHILFDSHQIILTEGLPTESFAPGPYTLREIESAAREELLALFPELAEAPEAYGPAARPALRAGEARLLGA